MPKDTDLVMVVRRSDLFYENYDYFTGFKEANPQARGYVDFESRIIDPNNYSFIMHKNAEDFSLKQPIAYCLIVNPYEDLVYMYRRGKVDQDPKLAGKFSIGSGGHIEPKDTIGNPVRESRVREVFEEVIIHGNTDVSLLGFINNDSNNVDKFHFGMLYLITTDAVKVEPKNYESDVGELVKFSEIEKRALLPATDPLCLESWSNIAVEPLRRYLGK